MLQCPFEMVSLAGLMMRPNAFRDMVHGWMRSSRQISDFRRKWGKSQLDEQLQSLWCEWILDLEQLPPRAVKSWEQFHGNAMHTTSVLDRLGSSTSQRFWGSTVANPEHKSLKLCKSAEWPWAGSRPITWSILKLCVRYDRARNSALAARVLHRWSPRIKKWTNKINKNKENSQVQIVDWCKLQRTSWRNV